MREALRAELEAAEAVWKVAPDVPAAIAPFGLDGALDHGFGAENWDSLRGRIGEPEAEADVMRAGAIMELWAQRRARPHKLKDRQFLEAARQEARDRRWDADERQQLFLGEIRATAAESEASAFLAAFVTRAGRLVAPTGASTACASAAPATRAMPAACARSC